MTFGDYGGPTKFKIDETIDLSALAKMEIVRTNEK